MVKGYKVEKNRVYVYVYFFFFTYRVVRLDVCLHTYYLYSGMIVYVFLLSGVKSIMVWVIDSFASLYANFTLMFMKENVEKFSKL